MDRVRHSRRIAAMRAEDPPRTWAKVAREIGMSSRQCQELLRQLQQSGDPDAPADPMAPIQRHLDVLEITMQEASATYASAPEGTSVRVGALRLMKEASGEMLDYMRLVGLLPRHLGHLAADREMQQVFREMAELLREHDADDDLLAGLLGLAERRLTGPPTVEARALSAS
jgi:DNA-binding Lrp family transcriptional regulator